MKILVVEDDEFVAHALTAVLTNQNYAVEVAADGQAAWDLVQAFDYDLIILDLILPLLDGISLCRQIRFKGVKTPILLLTGRDSSHDKAIGLDAGADDYLVKPFDSEELVARVRALLRRGSLASQPVLEWGDLQLDPSKCEVKYAQKHLALTPKEYALLELFMRNGHRVFSCGMILEHLWSYEDTPGEEAVRTHIKGLRQKLKAAAGKSDLIETVYGIGYRLKPLEKRASGAISGARGAGGENRKSKISIEKFGGTGTNTANVSQNQKSQQQTLSAVAGVWHRFKDRVAEQINVLEQAAEALSQDALSQKLLELAQKEAHTLAGSLGTFGFAQGSKLAREIENLLKGDRVIETTEANALRALVLALRQETEQEREEMTNTADSERLLLENVPHAEAHILAVDDDPKILLVLQKLLSPWGLKVTTLNEPQRFWKTLESTSPDLLILDVEMPHANGIDLCQIVRKDPRWSALPILFLTVHNDAEILDRVFSAGADDFVNKPIVGPELVTRIINRLERSKLLRRVAQTQRKLEHGAEAELNKSKNELELRVAERTAELIKVNERLQLELNERKRTQEALLNSQALFAGIVEIADDAIISINSNQCITLFNSGAEKIFGYSAAEVLRQPLDLLLPMRFASAHRQHVTEFGKSPSPARRMGERSEIYGRRKDGTEFPAEATISKLNLGAETVYTVYLRDVSDRKQIERMKDEFVSVVSHELRTPLTSIHGSLGMLASGLLQPDSQQGKRLLQIATDSTERLVRLINDVLDIERIESGKVKMEKSCCNVADLVEEAVNVMQSLANKAGVTLSVSSLPLQVWADPDRIVQTMTNLLSNAIKFSPADSTVSLAVQQQNDEVLFTVKDRGRGIPANKLDSIFERFQQVDSTDSRKHDGTGLGLAICRSIVQQHDGRIWVESVLGEGSTFYFTLPIFQTMSRVETKDFSIHPSPLILVCDDDPQIGAELQNLLESGGYRVVVVHSGKKAIALAASLRPDVILLDLLMPEMNGWEVMAVLKERADTRDIPIVICSIYTPTKSNPVSQDFTDWVSKPLDENSLFQSLRQALAKTSKHIRLLLVEDNKELAELLVTLLKRHNIETFVAKNGREAIRLSQEIKPDLLILDIILPQVDGFGVVEWLHQHNQLYSIPVVVYSAKELDNSERNRLKLGHTEFLTKGRVTPQEFEHRVIELIGQITQSKQCSSSNDNKENFGS